MEDPFEPSRYTPQSVQETYYSLNNLSSLNPIEIELYSQLTVDKSTTSERRSSWKQESPDFLSKASVSMGASTNCVDMAMSMLPSGMLPIGGESGIPPIGAGRNDDVDQHFIVQTALICEYLSSEAVHDPEEYLEDSRERHGLSFSAPGRPVELVLAGFLMLVVQFRFRQHRFAENESDTLALQSRQLPPKDAPGL